ncbi:hypothetical protein BBJ28_00020660 [Nothophytophthora sp. Chile5]|nr:hypothetical protein BBJ28_00020660 [Nothophytophthora sp. Chile5]
MGSSASRCVSLASASRVREAILVALGHRFRGLSESGQSARAWLTACFQRYDEVCATELWHCEPQSWVWSNRLVQQGGTGQVPCDAVLNVIAELTLFRIHEWSADEVSQFCAFFFRGEEGEQTFDYLVFLDYLFFPVNQHAPRIKLKQQIGTTAVFSIHAGELLSSATESEDPGDRGGCPVVLKRLDLTRLTAEAERLAPQHNAEELVDQLRHRVNELRLLTHPNLVAFQTTLQHQTSLYIVQEHHQSCTLRTILGSFGPMKEPTIRRYLLQMLQSLAFLHTHGAPEVLRDPVLWGEKTDVWCVGVLTLQMANGISKHHTQQASESFERNSVLQNNRQPGHSPPRKRRSEAPDAVEGMRLPSLPASASKGLKTLVRACLQRDPRERPSVEELMAMGFFRIDQAKETDEVLRTVCTDLDASMRRLISSSSQAFAHTKGGGGSSRGHGSRLAGRPLPRNVK